MGVSYHPTIVSNGLVLCLDAANPRSYPGNGTSWIDLSKNNYNCVLMNTVAYGSGAFVFNGSNNYVSLPTGLLSGTGDFTVTQYIASQSSGGNLGTTFANYSAGNLQIFFGGNFIGMYLGNTGCYLGASPWNTTLPEYTNNPTMITALRSNTTTMFYINGVLKKSGTSSFSIGTNSNSFRIGTNTIGTEQYAGKIFSTLVYNRALSESEIIQNYNALKGRYQ